MNTSLTKRGFMIQKNQISSEQLKQLHEELSVSPYVPKDYRFGNITKFNLYQESERNIYIPKSYGLKKFGVPSSIKISQGDEIPSSIKFTGSLRDEQHAPVNSVLDACKDPTQMGGILNVFCGGGKTTMALYILSVLRKKTLIVVHKDFLLEQWKERIKTFLPNARIGLIKAKICDIDNKDIVLGSLQSLSMKEYDYDKVFSGFGTLIIDEVHHTSAEVFSRALAKTSFFYTIGLSATVSRKDGLTKVFLWYLGDILYKSDERSDNVEIKHIQFEPLPEDPTDYIEEPILPFNGKPNMAKMINNICLSPQRNALIIKTITQITFNEHTRKILVLSDRRKHLEILKKDLESNNIQVGIYMGGMKTSDLSACSSKQVILATYAIACEGYDQPGLDTLVLASPKSDVVQSVGRILRDKPTDRKNVPLIIDIEDPFHGIFERQSQKRRTYYKRCNWQETN